MHRTPSDFDFTVAVFDFISGYLRPSEVRRLEELARANSDLFCAAAGYGLERSLIEAEWIAEQRGIAMRIPRSAHRRLPEAGT